MRKTLRYLFIWAILVLLLLAWPFIQKRRRRPVLSLDVQTPKITLQFDGSASKAVIVFSLPPVMTQGETSNAAVRVSMNSTAQVYEGLPHGTPSAAAAIEVSPTMSVKADPTEDFEVVALTPQDQFVAQDTFTEWDFRIQAVKSGLLHFPIRVGMRVKDASATQEVRYTPPFNEPILVQEDIEWKLTTFWRLHWEWTLGLLATPLVAAIISRLFGTKTSAGEGHA